MPDRLSGDATGIARAAELVAAGELIAFPTDTVYGIGCLAGHDAALARLFAAKRRPLDKAVPWLVASDDAIAARGFQNDNRVRLLTAAFWPGALTLVVAAAEGVRTHAFRVPDHPLTLALLLATGPLAVSSANRSGEPETLDADDVFIAFAGSDEPAAVIDGGRVPGGVASTVLDVSAPQARLIREGALSRAQIEGVIGRID